MSVDWQRIEGEARARLARGEPVEADGEMIAALLAAPIDPDLILYRLYTVALVTFGELAAAQQLYLPFIAAAARRQSDRPPWYKWKDVESAADAKGQSQRFESTAAEIDDEWQSICSVLEIGRSDRVLDVGAAGGLFTERLAQLAGGVVATDLSEALLGRARERLAAFPDVEVVRHDVAASAPLPSTFDKVLVAGVTPMLPNPNALAAALRNLSAMTAPGGRCLISGNFDVASAPDAAAHAIDHAGIELWGQLEVLENILWVDRARMIADAKAAGFSTASTLNERKRPNGRRMFDVLLTK